MTRLVGEWQRDFSGGWVDSVAPHKYADNQVAKAENARVEPDGSLRTRGAIRRTSTSAINSGARGYGLYGFQWNNSGSELTRWLAIFGDTAYDVTSLTGLSALTGTLPTTGYWSFTTFTQSGTTYVLMANGASNVYEFQVGGSAVTTATGYPSGVKYLATFNERVWYGGHSGVTVVGTGIRDRTDHASDAVSLQIQTHDGDPLLRGLHVHRDHLLVFKQKTVALVDGYGDSDIVVAAGPTGVSGSVGCIAPRSIVSVGDAGVLWLSERGVEFYQAGQPIQLLSRLNREWFADSIEWAEVYSDPDMPCAAYDATTQTYHLALPGSGATENTRVYVYNLSTGSATLDTLGNSDTYRTAMVGAPPPVSFSTDRDQPILGGQSSTGFLHVVDDRTVTNDHEHSTSGGGSAFEMTVRTRPMDFGDLGFNKKRARAIEVLGEASSNATLDMAIVTDGTKGAEQSVTLTAVTDGVSEARARVNGRGRTIQAEIQTTDDVKIAGVRVTAEPLKERV